MPQIPRTATPDATLALINDPYRFISKRCRKYGADLFETRLMLQKATCMTGPEAARLFYDNDRFMRRGAMVGRIQKTLLGRGGVQGLDDEAHSAGGGNRRRVADLRSRLDAKGRSGSI